jgi:hypothetical protein
MWNCAEEKLRKWLPRAASVLKPLAQSCVYMDAVTKRAKENK